MGNDGNWSSFTASVGTPPQQFDIFPATAQQEVWVPVPQACTQDDPSNCLSLRGSVSGDGFMINESTSWDLIGIYTLDTLEAGLGYSGNGDYGFDTVSIPGTGQNLTQGHQIVAGIADPSFWVGIFGLGPKPSNFSAFNDPQTTWMRSAVNDTLIPSLSFGYTAGASYQSPPVEGSLTLGGYDSSRFTPSDITFPFNADDTRPLQVGVQKIIGLNTLIYGGTANLLPTATFHLIDSTVPHIWLPDDAVDAFVQNFGLTYDNTTDLFLVNDTIHAQLINQQPTITFVLGTDTVGGDTQNIVLPYAAFDLQASWPYYENATNYFPIRRAANDTQYTIGRTFLQEAYLIADFERNNFTVAQANFTTPMPSAHVQAISQPSATSSSTATSTPTPPSGISGGAIAGIVIGVIVVLALVALGALFYIRRRKKRGSAVPTTDPDTDATAAAAFPDDKKTPWAEHRTSELPEETAVKELPSPPLQVPSEVDGGTALWGSKGVQELHTPPVGSRSPAEVGDGQATWLAEAPGSLGQRFELAGSQPVVQRPD